MYKNALNCLALTPRFARILLGLGLGYLALAGCISAEPQLSQPALGKEGKSPSLNLPESSSPLVPATPPGVGVAKCIAPEVYKAGLKNAMPFRGAELKTANAKNLETEKNSAANLRLLWISLDGLKYEDVVKYLKVIKNPHPKGFQYLINKKNWNRALGVTNPTITASSHLSTLTCTPPAVHGIFANSQWNGTKKIIGFDADYASEGFAQRLAKQGLKVATLGYPGLDGKTPERSVTLGSSYDNPKNQSNVLTLKRGVKNLFSVPLRSLNKEAPGVSFSVEAVPSLDGSRVSYKTNDGCSLTHELGQWANLVVEHEGKRSLVALLYVKKTEHEAVVFVSPTMENNAYPANFKNALNEQNLIFSPGKDSKIREQFGDGAYLKTLEHRLNYFRDTAHFILAKEKPEAFFLYFEDLDVLGHQYAGDAKADNIRGQHFAKLDEALGSVLELVPETADVVILGDHGMSAINYELSGNALLPATALEKTYRMSSGGSYFLYPKEGSPEGLQTPVPRGEQWFLDAVRALETATASFDNNKKIFAKVVVKGTAEATLLGLEGANMPWVIAFATPGIGISDNASKQLLLSVRKSFAAQHLVLQKIARSSDGADFSTLPEPVPLGAHGHFNHFGEMRTALVMYGPNLDKVNGAAVQMNIDVVPAVADALHLPRPAGCAIEAARVKVKLQK